MQGFVKFLYTIITTVSVFLTSVFVPAEIKPMTENFDFTSLQYPEEAVISLEEAGLTPNEFIYRADGICTVRRI